MRGPFSALSLTSDDCPFLSAVPQVRVRFLDANLG